MKLFSIQISNEQLFPHLGAYKLKYGPCPLCIILTGDSTPPFDCGWHGAPITCLIYRFLQYDWNLKSVINFAPSDVIVFGITQTYSNIL